MCNPYESPVACRHIHEIPMWLKRFITTVVLIATCVMTFNLIYMHKLHSRSSRFTGETRRAMIEQWLIDEWHGSPQPRNR